MSSPICDFVRRYNERRPARFHMPGHKGSAILGFEALDITEIDGADELFTADGIIAKSEAQAGALFGAHTVYATGGSTLCIQAMLHLSALYAAAKGERPCILAARNTHKAFINAAALLDIDIQWCYPETDTSYVSCHLSPEGIRQALHSCPQRVTAVYVTSPDYLGHMLDIRGIAEICHQAGALLLVDNAHGAHLRFLPRDRHPMTLGADLCCDSAHKTLPALTGAGYLHSNLPGDKGELKADMALFGSTSPSYLILASLDLCNSYLSGPAREEFAALEARTAEWEDRFRREGVALLPGKTDPTKLTLDCQAMGYSHEEAAARLREQGVEPEYAGGGKIVLMLSPQTPEADLIRTQSALLGLPRKAPLSYAGGCPSPDPVMTLREAAFAPWEEVPLAESVGRVAAETRITCPPAIPVIAAGERIGETEKNLLQNSGIFSIKVVK